MDTNSLFDRFSSDLSADLQIVENMLGIEQHLYEYTGDKKTSLYAIKLSAWTFIGED